MWEAFLLFCQQKISVHLVIKSKTLKELTCWPDALNNQALIVLPIVPPSHFISCRLFRLTMASTGKLVNTIDQYLSRTNLTLLPLSKSSILAFTEVCNGRVQCWAVVTILLIYSTHDISRSSQTSDIFKWYLEISMFKITGFVFFIMGHKSTLFILTGWGMDDTVFSSPEHVLMVSYCDRSLSIIRALSTFWFKCLLQNG